MTAIGFVLIVLGIALLRAGAPSDLFELVNQHKNGPSKASIAGALLFVIGALLATVGVAIKLWGLMP